MSFLQPSAEQLGTPEAVQIRAADLANWGFPTNYSELFALAPAAYAAWAELNKSIKAGMDPRRYELATLAVAMRRGSTYCSVAHGVQLQSRFYDTETVRRIAADYHDAGLDEADVAIMDFAVKAADGPASITAADVAGLREHGLDDRDVFQVLLAVGARCFFTTVLEGAGAQADPEYLDRLGADTAAALTVGRPIAVS
ncbi:carboxymuconolactone decarboxylase family protein [Hamadaea tsunoensis]|uniref:carboxymuconolactone decarboxylase family protein n=1 Tax=Hamadaea tsunoensis TaxID=53368 RepID=UPI0003FE206E|nr:carboxymuconolactone decarboxylase family protein [Hamadaea tsunoensis]